MVESAPGSTQPYAHEMALAFRLRPIFKGRAFVADATVVDDLNLAGLEVELSKEIIIVNDVGKGIECCIAEVINLAFGQFVALANKVC